METKRLFTLISLLIFFLSFGQNSVLWKVTNKNTALTSFILGTYHLAGQEFVNSHPIILEKMKAADLVITETEINRSKFSAYYNLRPSSDMLPTILSPEDLAYLKEIFADEKIDLEKYTPAELLLKLQVYYPKYRCSALKNTVNLPMDEYIQQLADLNKKELYYLESALFYLAILLPFFYIGKCK